MDNPSSKIGLIGPAVMGQNLALNIADHGFKISVYNRTFQKTKKFLEENLYVSNLCGFQDLNEFINLLADRERLLLWCKHECNRCRNRFTYSFSRKDDIIIDGGNAKWTDS